MRSVELLWARLSNRAAYKSFALRSLLADADLHKLSLDCGLLICHQFDVGFKGLIPRKLDDDPPFSRSDKKPSADSSEFSHVADEDAIDKNSGAIGVHIKLNFGGYHRHLNPAIALHGHADDLLFAGLDADFLHEVQITALPDCDFVFTWQEEDLFGPLQFLQITKILPIDPYSGRSLYFGGAQELNFTQYIVSSVQNAHENWREQKTQQTHQRLNLAKTSHTITSFALPEYYSRSFAVAILVTDLFSIV